MRARVTPLPQPITDTRACVRVADANIDHRREMSPPHLVRSAPTIHRRVATPARHQVPQPSQNIGSGWLPDSVPFLVALHPPEVSPRQQPYRVTAALALSP